MHFSVFAQSSASEGQWERMPQSFWRQNSGEIIKETIWGAVVVKGALCHSDLKSL